MVELKPPVLKKLLLSSYIIGRRSFDFSTYVTMHTLVSAVLLRVSRVHSVDLDT